MNDPILIRQAIRRALSLRVREGGLTELVLFEAVKVQGFLKLTVPELLQALEWNLTRDFVTFEKNDDLDADVWTLTGKGKIKEGIA